jgi:multidrug efflux pump subunit AcrA (membrane-fusion protein)
MGGQAKVNSFAALSEFRASLATFASVATTALDEAGTDIQRTIQWLKEDRYRYWKAQVQTRTEQYTRARLALKQREVLDRAVAGTHSSCVEERRAVRITEKRLRDAENKFRLVGMYSRQIEKESLEYKGSIHGLVNALEVEIPNACASLERMVKSLEQYVALAPPEMPLSSREGVESPVMQPSEETVEIDRNQSPDESANRPATEEAKP